MNAQIILKRLVVNTKNTTSDELLKVATKCGFFIFRGGKHDKVKTSNGEFITTIPRHNHIKRETAKAIIEKMIEFGARIDFI